jgi:serine/threonine-protein kinase
LSPGSSFGRYVVESRLARGGMGEVWLATARGPGGFQKRVVIKTVLPDLMEKPAYVQMLVREASLAARLDHPNIVHVFDLGCVHGMYYIAMEYLSGRSLAQMLRRSHDLGQRLPLRVLLTMIAISCDGLQYAHDYADDDGSALGLLHRDISPSNIMLTFSGRVALLDFGVATATRGKYKTKSGTIKGKFHYLAPERVRGEQGDRRSDIYSLGVVLYQCLTLRWPFRAQNEYELLRQIANESPPPVRHYAPWITGRLEHIILRAMANDADARHQQASELASELRDYLRSIGAVVESSELANCLAGLFSEAPEAIARRQNTPATVHRAEAADDGIQIVYQSNDSSEQSEPSESTALDQPDPVMVGVGSPLPDGDERPSAAAARRRVLASLPGPASVRPEPTSSRRPVVRDDDVDIFPEPTRSLPPRGGDVFGAYASPRARPRRSRSEPPFLVVKGPAQDAGGWPWARTIDRAESSPSKSSPSETPPQDSDAEKAG